MRLLVRGFHSMTMPCLLLLRPPWRVGDAFYVRPFVAKAVQDTPTYVCLCGIRVAAFHPFIRLLILLCVC